MRVSPTGIYASEYVQAGSAEGTEGWPMGGAQCVWVEERNQNTQNHAPSANRVAHGGEIARQSSTSSSFQEGWEWMFNGGRESSDFAARARAYEYPR